MKHRPYLKKWKSCNKCIKEICKNIHDNTDEDYLLPKVNYRLLVDGINFNIDVLCMAPDDVAGHSVSPKESGTIFYENKNLLSIFNYILNNFKELQLEDAIKITNLRSKQLNFERSKK